MPVKVAKRTDAADRPASRQEFVDALKAAVAAFAEASAESPAETAALKRLRSLATGELPWRGKAVEGREALRFAEMEWPALSALALSDAQDSELSAAMVRMCERICDMAWESEMAEFVPDQAALEWLRAAARRRAGARTVAAYLGLRMGADGNEPVADPCDIDIKRFRDALRKAAFRSR